MAGGRAALIWTIAVASLLIVVGLVGVMFIDGVAHENLSNADFVRTHDWLPSDSSIPSQNVTFASGLLQLVGWWMPAASDAANDTAQTTIILVHGYGSNASKPLRIWGANLHGAGYSLLAFDLRNHGASPDGPKGYVTYGMKEADDVAAAVQFVQTNAATLGVNASRIVLYGGSMGGASVLNMAAQQPSGVIGVIADSSYASFTFEAQIDGEAKGYPRALVDLVLKRMDAKAPAPPTHSRPEIAITSISIPIFLAHCSNDGMVTLPNMERLVDRAPTGTSTWVGTCMDGLNPEHHLDAWTEPSYHTAVRRFLAQL